MAFSKQPEQSTYQTKQIKLLGELDRRGSNVDQDLDYLNCFVELTLNKMTGDQSYHIVKRAGLQTVTAAPLPLGTVRGLYFWEDQSKIFVAVADDILVLNANTGAAITTLNNVFGTTTGDVGFTEFYYDDTTVKVVATDGTTLLTIDSANTVVPSADGDLPTPHLPQPIFLDGYIFLAKAGTADIYNSNLNDPLAWTPGDFISAEMFPDVVLRIAKLNNYLVVFGSASIEYFWDAGNTSGSPLQRNDTPVKLYGYVGGFAQEGNRIYFVANSSTGTPDVFYIEDFKLESIGTPTVRRYLESLTINLEGVIGNVTSFMGHDFYVLNASTRTYVYDLKTKLWARWAFKEFGNFTLEHSVSVKNNTTSTCIVYLNSENHLFRFNPTVYQDIGSVFVVRIVTDTQWFDSYNQKTMNRLTVLADRVPNFPPWIGVSWTDDDYLTFSTEQFVLLNQEIPCIYRLGRFRRRAFKLIFTTDNPLRIHGLEVDINLGIS